MNFDENFVPLHFFLPIKIPSTTAQEHRVISQGKGKRALFIDTPELADARQKYLAYLSQHKPPVPLEGPIRLHTIWCYPSSQSHHHGQWKTSKPDTDNLVKLFKDCMTKVGFWKDDAQVASEIIEKRFCDTPGIFVEIFPLSAKTEIEEEL